MNDVARDTPKAQTTAAWGSDAIADLLRALDDSVHRAHARRELSRPARQPRQPSRQHAAGTAAVRARGARGRARARLRARHRQAARGRAARERRADARDDGDLQRLVRSHSDPAAGRRRSDRRRASGARGSTGSTRRATWARSCAATPSGTTSPDRSPPRSKRSCARYRIAMTLPQGPVYVCARRRVAGRSVCRAACRCPRSTAFRRRLAGRRRRRSRCASAASCSKAASGRCS